MKRTVVVVVLAVAALGLLVLFAWQSRSAPADLHIAQYTVANETSRLNEDFATLVATLQAAWRDTERPGEAAVAIEERIKTAPERIAASAAQVRGTGSQNERIQNSLEGLTTTIEQVSSLAVGIIQDQNAFVDSVAYLRDSGPAIIQQMRDMGLERVAADAFQLIIGTVDYATPDSSVQEYELRRLLVTLGRDQRIDANMPGGVGGLRTAVLTIVDTKSTIRSKLVQLSETPVAPIATGVDEAVRAAYRDSVAAVDRARLMLAIYAIVLFVAVGIITFRLQGSYREVNRANRDLADMNTSLEQRVTDRTEQLAGTLENLKESQVQLVQAEKMSSLGQLVAGISHEINTPLLYLANNATLLRERVDMLKEFVAACSAAFDIKVEQFRDRAEYQAKFVESLRSVKLMLRDQEIVASLEEAGDLVKDSIEGLGDLTQMAQSLKDFSRLDRAPVASFDVNAGIDKTLVIARNIIKHKAEVHKFYGEIPEIECSPSKINQVFLNLLTNAAQAIEQRGEIVITTKRRGTDHVAIAISDTGCGIPEENLSKIRDPFFTTKEVGTGTGLGLSIVDEIIRSHGGELLVESKVGKGSTFTVVLPIKHVRVAEPAVAEVDPTTLDAEPELAEAV
ncbi:MAG TPA: ATP-binding protein [Gammaproteobacteria bacterium]|jgi:signal transduction histidine kinase